jgi:hypothetical protein
VSSSRTTLAILTILTGLALPGSIALAQNTLPPIQGGGYGNPGYGATTPGYSTYPPANTYSNPYPGQYSGANTGYGAQPLQGYVVTAPAGTTVPATVSSPISSEFARVGDRFTVNLSGPLATGGSVLLPAGSQVEGQVVMVKAAGRTGRNGELEIRFSSAILPGGQRLPLSARLQTEDNTGILKGGSTGGRVGRALVSTGVGSGLGAALGTAMGPLSGGGVGRGAIYGTVLGAGMGALGAAWQKGKPAVIDTSQPLNIVLDQPLTTSPADGGGYAPAQAPYGQPAYGQNY